MDIRKISIGSDYPNGAMHYQRGKDLNLAGVRYTITDILLDQKLGKKGIIAYNIYIANDKEKVLWKQISGLPTVVESNIQFE